MTTEQQIEQKPKRKQPNKVQAVLTEALKTQLDRFKAEKGYENDGEALRAILTAFFNGEVEIDGGSTEHLEQRIASLENALYHDDMDIPKRAEEAFNEYKSLDDAFKDVAECQSEQNGKIRDLEKQIQEIKASLEANNNSDISEDTQEISVEKEPIKVVETTTNDEDTMPQQSQEKSQEVNKPTKNSIPPNLRPELRSHLRKNTPEGITQEDLAKRLGVSGSFVGRKRKEGQNKFKEWSASKDPEGIAWRYDGKKYKPVNLED